MASAPPVDEDLESYRKHEEGRFGPRFGMTVHHAIGYVLSGAEGSSERAVQRAAKAVGLDEHLDEATLDVRRSVDAIRKEGWSGAEGPDFRLEYPVSGPGADGVLLLGSIDLVAIERGRVSIVDFKTDAPPSAGAPVPPHYQDQARTYAQLLTEAGLTSDQGLRPGLLYTADGILRWFDEHYGLEGDAPRQNA